MDNDAERDDAFDEIADAETRAKVRGLVSEIRARLRAVHAPADFHAQGMARIRALPPPKRRGLARWWQGLVMWCPNPLPVLCMLLGLSLAFNVWQARPIEEPLVFVVDLAEEELLVLRNVLNELEGALGTTIVLQPIDSSRYVSRLDKIVASGASRWDLIAVDNTLMGTLRAKELVEDLSRFKAYEDLIPANLLPVLRSAPPADGRYYFVPFRPNVKVTFYNKTKFDQYDLTPPTTWEELLHVAKVFNAREGVGRVAIQGYPGKTAAATVFEFVTAAGGNPLTLDDAGTRSAFAFLQQLAPYLAPGYPTTAFDTANARLIDDEVYLVSNWTYGVNVVMANARKDDVAIYSGWRGPARTAHVLGGDMLAIPRGAPNPQRALKLIELLVAKTTQQTLASHLFWAPVREDAIPPGSHRDFTIVGEVLAHAVVRPSTPGWSLVEEVLDRAFQEVVVHGKNLETASQQYIARLQQIPSRYVGHVVTAGESLHAIAQRYHTEADILVQVNGRTSWRPVSPDEMRILLVPQQ